MELRQLECFVAVAEEQSFTRASARLHLVQSGVSAAVKALEHEVGAQLFDRSSRHVWLTEAGQALLPRARDALDAVRDAQDAVDQVQGGLRGTLRIGTLTSLHLIDVPALLGRYHRLHPQVTLRLTAVPTGSVGLVEALVDGSLDVAFVSLPGRPPAGVLLREVAADHLDLVVPAGHPLADLPRVGLADLAEEPFVDFPVGYGNRAVADRAFAAAGVERHVTIEITDIATASSFVREGLGIALLPRFVIPRHDDLRQLRVSGADLRWPLAVATARGRRTGAAARTLVELALA